MNHAGYKNINYQSVEDHPSTFLHDDALGATDSTSS